MTPSGATLDFYFDYLSPYAYFTALRLPEICQSRGLCLAYHPVLFAGLLEHWGQLDYLELYLDGKDPWAQADPESIRSQGRAVMRAQWRERNPDVDAEEPG